MEKTDVVVIEQITNSEFYNELIAEAGGWDEFCKEWEVEIVHKVDDEVTPDFTKDGIPYRLGGHRVHTIQYDYDWYHNNF